VTERLWWAPAIYPGQTKTHENMRKAIKCQSGVIALYPVSNCNQEQKFREEYKNGKFIIFPLLCILLSSTYPYPKDILS